MRLLLSAACLALASACASGEATRSSASAPARLDARALVELRYVGGGEYTPALSVSPDGERVAFAVSRADVEANDYDLTWHVLDLRSRRLIDVGDGGEMILNIRQRIRPKGATFGQRARWSPDGRWIAYARQDNGEIHLWRSSADGRVQERLTSNAADVLGSVANEALFWWSEDGGRIFYYVARDRDGMRAQMTEEGARGFLFDDRFTPEYDTAPGWIRCGGSRFGEAPVPSQACEPTLWVYDVAARSERLATEAEREAYPTDRADATWSRLVSTTEQGRVVDASGAAAWLENDDPERFRGNFPPMRLRAATADGEALTCEDPRCASQYVDGVWWVDGDVVFARREGVGFGASGVYVWDVKSGVVRTILRTDDLLEACQPARETLVCFQESADRPRRVVSIDPETGAVSVEFDPNAWIAHVAFTPVEHLSWENADRQSTFGKLVFPAGYQAGARRPLVIVQGDRRGFLEGGAGNEYPAHLLAAEGFFVLVTDPYADDDLRASARGMEQAVAEFKTHDRRKRALSAYADAIAALDARGLIDPDRVAITGLSSGSANARYGLIHSDLFATAIFSTGYSGPQQYWFTQASMRAQMKLFIGEAPLYSDAVEAFLAEENLGFHAREKLFPPLLWQVADSELSHALFDHNLLQDAGQPVEMIVFPEEHHIKSQPVHRYSVYRRNIQWMKFWLQGETVADPVDPDQYRRWRNVCSAYVARLLSSDVAANRTRAAHQPCREAADREVDGPSAG